MLKFKFKILNNNAKPIAGDLRFVNDGKLKPAIFIMHGFKGFKDWGFFPYISEKFATAGAITVCYNFSLNGMVEGSDLVENLDDFANNTISQELEDSLFIISKFKEASLLDSSLLKENWNGKIFLLGHSLGGAISVLTAKFNPEIEKIALWASISTFNRYTDRQKQIWRQKGFNEFQITRTGQVLRMNLEYMEDVIRNSEKYDLVKSMAEIKAESLIIHGRQDFTVRFAEAQALYDAADKNKVILADIKHTGHTFGIEHPFTKTSKALETVLETTIKFYGLI